MHLVPLSDFGVLKTYRLRDKCVYECTHVYKSMMSLIFTLKVDLSKWMSSVEDFSFHEDFESEEIGVTLKISIFMRGLWSVKSFVFVVSFSLSWVIGNTVLLKGVEVKLRKHFPSDAHLKILHLPFLSSEAIGNLIQFSQFLQWQRRRSSGLWGICSGWGVRN